MIIRILTLPALLLCLPLSAIAAPQLKTGDPAPPIKVAKWIKGQPVETYDPGQVHVVEFWATTCAPCTKSAPHLSELAKKFEGKARVIGISVKEPDKTDHAKRLATIERFVEKMGDKMAYTVAADTNDAVMEKSWLEAAGETGIPVAFIVGKDGKVVWIGHPMGGLDEKLEQTVAGTLDLNATQAEAAQRQQANDAKARVRALFKPINDLLVQGKSREGIAALDQLVAEHPDLAKLSVGLRFHLLLAHDEAAASRLARQMLDGDFKDDGGTLYTMCRDLTEPVGRKDVDWDVALALGKRAAELRNHDSESLCALAHAYYRKGDVPMAIETADAALAKSAAAGGDGKFLKRRLDLYQATEKR